MYDIIFRAVGVGTMASHNLPRWRVPPPTPLHDTPCCRLIDLEFGLCTPVMANNALPLLCFTWIGIVCLLIWAPWGQGSFKANSSSCSPCAHPFIHIFSF